MDEQMYLSIALWLTNRTESVLQGRFNERRRDVLPSLKKGDSDPQSSEFSRRHYHEK